MEDQLPPIQAVVQTDRLAMLSVEHSRQALQNLERLVDDLQQQISSSKRLKRGIARVKVTLKKDLIRTYQDRLQNALQLLSLSQQTHLIAMSRIQTLLLLSTVQTRRATERNDQRSSEKLSPSNGNDSHALINQKCISQIKKLGSNMKLLPRRNSNRFWRFTYQIAEISASPDETNQIYQARLQLPWWLLSKAWDLQARKSYSGWKVSLTPWSVRSDDSGVFRYVLQGSTKDLLRVLNSNEASLYDRNSGGWALLHYAACGGHFEMSQKLLEFGLSVEETDAFGTTPLYHITSYGHNLGEILDIYRHLSSQGALDEAVQDPFHAEHDPILQSSLHRLVWKNSELLDFIVTQFHPNFYQLAASDRFGAINWLFVDQRFFSGFSHAMTLFPRRIFLPQFAGVLRAPFTNLHGFTLRNA